MARRPVPKPARRTDRGAARAKLLALALAVIGVDAAQAQAVRGDAAQAQATGADAVEATGLRVEQTLTTRLTYTDNIRASSDGGSGRFLVELTPGLIVSMPKDGGRVDGYLDVNMRNVLRASDDERRNEQNRSFIGLRAGAEVEAVKRLLFVDVDASIDRSSLSSFSGRIPGDFLSTDEGNETRFFSVAPRLEFKVMGDTAVSLRYLRSWLDSGRARFSPQNLSQWSASASNPRRHGLFGWSLDYTRSQSEYDRGGFGDVTEEVGRASLFWNATRRFRVRGTVGRESNDYTTGTDNSGTIVGAGFEWDPSPRTNLSAYTEKRTFGRGYDVQFNHRRPLSTWSLSYARNTGSSLRPVLDTTWELLYEQFAAELVAIDPTLEQAEVDRRVRQMLDALGVPDNLFADGIVTNVQYLEKVTRAAVSLLGARNVVTLTAQRTERERIGGAVTGNPVDDLAQFNNIEQLSAAVLWNHKLSGHSTLNAGITHLDSRGRSVLRDTDTRRWVASVGVTSTLGARTVGSLTYRHQRAAGNAEFTENVLTASVTMTF